MWTILGTGLLAIPAAIAEFTVRDGWLSVLTMMLTISISAGIAWMFERTFPGQSLVTAFRTAFGKLFGTFVGVCLVFWACLDSAVVAREFMVFAETTILPKTPLFLTDLGMFLLVTYALYIGFESIARLTEFILPLFIIAFLILVGLSLNDMNFGFLRPVLMDGWKPVLQGSILTDFVFSIEFMMMLQLLPRLKKGILPTSMLISGVIVTLILLIVELFSIAALGGSITYLPYPLLEIIRGIRIGEFIQRFDTIYVIGVIAGMFIKICTFQYVFVSSLRDVLQVEIKLEGQLVVATSALTWMGTIVLANNSGAISEYIIHGAPPYFILMLLVVPALTISAQHIKSWLSRSITVNAKR